MVDDRQLRARLAASWRSVFRPRETGPIGEWGRENIILSSTESGDFPGPYDPDLNPLPTVLFDAYQSGLYKKIVFKKSSQSGVTAAVLVLMTWFVTYIVRNVLYVIDSVPEAREISDKRFQPMVFECKAAKAIGRILTREMSALACRFKGCVVFFRGSNSVGGLSNKSVGLAIYDEVDSYKRKKTSRERATELGRERGKRQTNFIEVLLSKPQDWDDTINQEYLQGTRHKCFCPCPHCGTFQEIEWERIKFDHLKDEEGKYLTQKFDDGVYLECVSEECRKGEHKGRIHEHHKVGMIAAREWRQTNFGEDGIGPVEGVFSCEITDLYSTFPGITWAALAQEFVGLLGDPEGRETFFRGRLARPTKRKKIVIDTGDIQRLCGRYARGHVPEEVDVILMASDVQQSPPLKKWVKGGFRLSDDACFVVDYGEFLSFDDLLEEANEPVIVDRWNRFTPAEKRIDPVTRQGLVDERHDPGAVRDFIISSYLGPNLEGLPSYRFYGCRGWGGIHAKRLRDVVVPPVGRPPNASHKGYPLWVYDLSDDHFKDLLYNRTIARQKERHAALDRGEQAPPEISPLWLPALVEPEFTSELCQEKYVFNPETKRWEWEKPKGANDWGDALKYLFVAWYLLKPTIAMEKARAFDAALLASGAAAARN
jgi:phage terminase large subunit GpA-like protein